MPSASKSNSSRTRMQDSYRNLKARRSGQQLSEIDQAVDQSTSEATANNQIDLMQMADPNRVLPASKPSLPDVSAVFQSFNPPFENRTFKTEPMDDNEWRAEQERNRQEAIERKQREKEERERVRAEKLAEREAARAMMEAERNERGSVAPQSQQRTVVDLTDDLDDVAPSPPAQAHDRPPPQGSNVRFPPQPRPLAPAQIQMMDQAEIPANMLQQAREVYQNEQIMLPGNVRRWIDLKAFAAQRPNNAINPRVILIAQAHAFQSIPVPSDPPQYASTPNAANAPLHRSAYGNTPSASVSGHTMPTVNHAALPSMRQIKIEAEEQDLQQQIPPCHQASATRDAQHMHNTTGNRITAVHDTMHRVEPQRAQPMIVQSASPPAVSQEQILQLVQPIELMADILPPDAPEGHPHLVNIWEQALVDLPTEQHRHLNLPDTAVSILAKYDLEGASVIKPFLDLVKYNQFFFLFKARDTHTHSWSIEREGNIVSIGIENWKRSRSDEGPSAGQFNVSFVFRIAPTMPTTLDPLHVKRNPENPAEPEHAEEDEEPERMSPDAQPKVPGRWVLHNFSIVPAVPDLYTYLYHTPASRGADSHTLVSHPNQSHLLDPADLSTLARYMQQTFCTSKVMDTEIQVAYGRKVKYDAQLGRIRQVYDYALKGAKTQKLKRERGEYNRPKNRPGATEAPAGDQPGAGESKGYLAGTRRGFSVNEVAELEGETRVDTGSLRGDLRDFVVEDEERGEARRARKRQRLRREGGIGGVDSGSNFSDDSDGD